MKTRKETDAQTAATERGRPRLLLGVGGSRKFGGGGGGWGGVGGGGGGGGGLGKVPFLGALLAGREEAEVGGTRWAHGRDGARPLFLAKCGMLGTFFRRVSDRMPGAEGLRSGGSGRISVN